MPAVIGQGPGRRLVIEVLYVEGCPNYRGALGLVERVRAELGIDAELRTTLISDQVAADQARFPGSPTVRVDDRDVEPGWVREALLRAAGRT